MDFEPFFAVTTDVADPGFSEDGDIEARRFFGLAVEPQAGSDFLQSYLPFLPIPAAAHTNRAEWAEAC